MKTISIASLLLLLFSASAEAKSKGSSLNHVVDKLQANYGRMKDYRAHFTQVTKIKAYPRPQKSSGEVFYKKPGKMRWNYDSPEKQEIVTDGKTVYMYTPALNQVMKAGFAETGQSRVAEAFLSGMGNLKRDFNITTEKSGEDYNVLLLPKDGTDNFMSLKLTVDGKTFHVKRSEMTDIYENVTIVTFSALKVNGGLKNKLFDFKIPKGVDVVTPPSMH